LAYPKNKVFYNPKKGEFIGDLSGLQGLSTVSEAAISGARDSRAIIFRQPREKGISGFEECAHWRAPSLTVLTPCKPIISKN